MASELTALKSRNILAIGLVGFSGAFALFLLRGVFLGQAGMLASALNLIAAVVLIVAAAITWPQILAPRSARASWRAIALVALGCGLALVARMPGVHV